MLTNILLTVQGFLTSIFSEISKYFKLKEKKTTTKTARFQLEKYETDNVLFLFFDDEFNTLFISVSH